MDLKVSITIGDKTISVTEFPVHVTIKNSKSQELFVFSLDNRKDYGLKTTRLAGLILTAKE